MPVNTSIISVYNGSGSFEKYDTDDLRQRTQLTYVISPGHHPPQKTWTRACSITTQYYITISQLSPEQASKFRSQDVFFQMS